MKLSITTLCIQRHYAECRYAERCNLFIIMLSVVFTSSASVSYFINFADERY
jgi:hypothetical protein